jgi:hypothetical protein
MIILTLLLLLLSNSITLRRDKSILYSRVTITILVISSLIPEGQNNTNSVNALDIQNNVAVGQNDQLIKIEDFQQVSNYETLIHKIKSQKRSRLLNTIFVFKSYK